MNLNVKVYIRGYEDARFSDAGFTELIDYGGDPPPSWVREGLRALHQKLADRPSVEPGFDGKKPQGALFLTLDPPARFDDEPYYAIVYMKPTVGKSGRSGYELLAVFERKSLFNVSGPEWLSSLARYWAGIRWDRVAELRRPNYSIDVLAHLQPGPTFRNPEIGAPSDEWSAQVLERYENGQEVLPVAQSFLHTGIATRLSEASNVVIGLDSPLRALGSGWRWIKVGGMKRIGAMMFEENPKPKRDLDPMERLVENRSKAEIAQMQEWVRSARSNGIKRDAIVQTMAASGWPKDYIAWYLDQQQGMR